MPHVHVNGGTLDAITILSGGTVNIGGTPTVKAVGGTIAMLQAGTISSLPNVSGTVTLNGGTVGLVQAGTISMLQAGTISSLPAITGSVAVTSGTITELPAISGTVGVSAGTIDAATLATGTAHIGEVGGADAVIAVTPPIGTAAYTAKDAVGGLLTFAGAARVAGKGGVIHAVTIIDNSAQAAEFTINLFNQTFTPTADADQFDPSDADLLNSIGKITVAASDYTTYKDNAQACKTGIGLPYVLAGTNTAIFGELSLTTGTPTYAGTADLTVKLHLLQD